MSAEQGNGAGLVAADPPPPLPAPSIEAEAALLLKPYAGPSCWKLGHRYRCRGHGCLVILERIWDDAFVYVRVISGRPEVAMIFGGACTAQAMTVAADSLEEIHWPLDQTNPAAEA